MKNTLKCKYNERVFVPIHINIHAFIIISSQDDLSPVIIDENNMSLLKNQIPVYGSITRQNNRYGLVFQSYNDFMDIFHELFSVMVGRFVLIVI